VTPRKIRLAVFGVNGYLATDASFGSGDIDLRLEPGDGLLASPPGVQGRAPNYIGGILLEVRPAGVDSAVVSIISAWNLFELIDANPRFIHPCGRNPFFGLLRFVGVAMIDGNRWRWRQHYRPAGAVQLGHDDCLGYHRHLVFLHHH